MTMYLCILYFLTVYFEFDLDSVLVIELSTRYFKLDLKDHYFDIFIFILLKLTDKGRKTRREREREMAD